MAVATQSAQLVRQKTFMINRNPFIFFALKAYFLYNSLSKGNPDLQLVNIDGTYSSSDGGNNASQVLVNGACTLYVVYGKKIGATETIFKATNHASTAATDGTQDQAFAATAAGEFLYCYPDGRALSTGLTITENTARTTSTLTLKANRIDGFVIVGV